MRIEKRAVLSEVNEKWIAWTKHLGDNHDKPRAERLTIGLIAAILTVAQTLEENNEKHRA